MEYWNRFLSVIQKSFVIEENLQKNHRNLCELSVLLSFVFLFFFFSHFILTSLVILHFKSTLLLPLPSSQHPLFSVHRHLVVPAPPAESEPWNICKLVVFQKVGWLLVLHSDGINFPIWRKCQSLVTVSDAKQPEWFQDAVRCLKRTPNRNLKTQFWPWLFYTLQHDLR